MRKRISLLVAALMLALTMSFSGLAFAFGHDEGCTKEGSTVTCPGKNKNWTSETKGSTNSSHPDENTNKGGNKPPGQN
jgi:hypothetical protein